MGRTAVPRFDIATLGSGNTYEMHVRYVLQTSGGGVLCSIESSNSSQIVASGTAPPAPIITRTLGLGSDACEGEDVELTASVSGTPSQLLWEGPQGYSAEGSSTITLPDISVEAAGKYSFYYVTGEDCASERAEFTLTVRLLPFPQIFTSAPFSCEGATFSVDLASTDFPGLTYQWRRDGGGISGATTSAYNALQAGDYTITISDGVCSKTSQALTLTEIPPPAFVLPDCDFFCVNIEGTIHVDAAPSTAAPPGFSVLGYRWSMGDGTVYDNSGASVSHMYSVTGDYVVDLETFYMRLPTCRSMGSTSARVFSPSPFALTATPNDPEKCPLEIVTISSPATVDSPEGETLDVVESLWSTGETTLSIMTREPGNYAVEVKDAAGCTLNDAYEVRNKANSGITLRTLQGDSEERDTLRLKMNEGDVVSLMVDDAKSVEEWTPTLGVSNPLALQTRFTAEYDDRVDIPYTYVVRATDRTDCEDESVMIIDLIPNPMPQGLAYFSPNGDSQLDIWHIYKLDLNPDRSCSVQVFDRRGSEVFAQSDLPRDWQGWDGLKNGREVPTDVYFYIIECRCEGEGCPRRTSGSIFLVRD